MGKREVLARVGSMEGETGRVRLEGGNGEGEGSNGKRETGKGAKVRGRRRGKGRGDFTNGHDEMPGWNKVTEFSDFAYPCNAGYPS